MNKKRCKYICKIQHEQQVNILLMIEIFFCFGWSCCHEVLIFVLQKFGCQNLALNSELRGLINTGSESGRDGS